MRRSASRLLSLAIWISTILARSSGDSGSNSTMSSRRFRNSGRNACLTTPITEFFLLSASSSGSAMNWLPRFDVRISSVLRKSTVRP